MSKRTEGTKTAQTINLVKEYNARLTIPSFFEEQPELPLRLSNPLAQAVCTFAHEERYEELVRTMMAAQGMLDVQMPLPFDLQLAAKARARSVFPVPGGPWNSTPRGGVRLKR